MPHIRSMWLKTACFFGVLLMWVSAVGADQAPTASDRMAPAHFRVLKDPLPVAAYSPFTATIGGVGNVLLNGAFEPMVFRHRFMAQGRDGQRVLISPAALSHYESFRTGYLDGARVDVYRVTNGAFRAVGWHIVQHTAASGWSPVLPVGELLAPQVRSFAIQWAAYNRPAVDYYFSISAIDRLGRRSGSAQVLKISPPVGYGSHPPLLVAEKVVFKGLTAETAPGLPVPGDFRFEPDGQGNAVLHWNMPVSKDVVGFLLERSDSPPAQHEGYALTLASEGVPDVEAGDLLVVSKRFYQTSRQDLLANRVWADYSSYGRFLPGLVNFFPDEVVGKHWSLVPHGAEAPFAEAGETFLRLRVGDGDSAKIGTYNHAGRAQSWYPVLANRPYRVSVWLRSPQPVKVRFRAEGFYSRPENGLVPIDFDVGPVWQRYTADFSPSVIQDSSQPGFMGLEVKGAAALDVDNFRVYRADAPFLDELPENYARLAASQMSALRTHALIKTGMSTYDLAQLTNAGGLIQAVHRSNTLPQTLSIMKKAGVLPWLQVEWHLQPEEWLGLVEYLAAPFDPAVDTAQSKPWAFKRYQQGQKRPWVDEFPKIYFELGNETWNRLFYPWNFEGMRDYADGTLYSSGAAYGLFQEYVLALMRQSPYWQSSGLAEKLVPVLGGWNGFGYGKDAAAVSPNSAVLGIAAYNGGWDNGESAIAKSLPGYAKVLSNVLYSDQSSRRHRDEAAFLAESRGRPLQMATYEAGPGYALNGLNGERVTPEQAWQQERVMKSVAAGTATLDAFLSRSQMGYSLQNFFTLDSGEYWKSHAHWFKGGQAFPSWQLLSAFNRWGVGEALQVDALSLPTIDLPAIGRLKPIPAAPLVATYATRQKKQYFVALVSRKVPDYPLVGDDGYTPVRLDLPFKKAAKVRAFQFDGAFDAHNVDADTLHLQERQVPRQWVKQSVLLDSSGGFDPRGLPPGQTILLVFENVR